LAQGWRRQRLLRAFGKARGAFSARACPSAAPPFLRGSCRESKNPEKLLVGENPKRRVVLATARLHHSAPSFALPPMTRGDGTPVNAVFGFSSMLFKQMQDHADDDMIVVFDAGRLSFRNEIYDKYRPTAWSRRRSSCRSSRCARRGARFRPCPRGRVAGFEADDLIATYVYRAREQGREVVIVSSDKDLMQLVADGVLMWDPIKSREIGPAEVEERFGVGPELVRTASHWPATAPTTSPVSRASASRPLPSSCSSSARSTRCSPTPRPSSSQSAARP
jgi:hypothetical protein